MAGSARSRASNALHVKTTASGPSGAKRTNCAKPAKAFANRLLSFALPARSLACVRRPCGRLTQERGLEWHKVGVLRAAVVVVGRVAVLPRVALRVVRLRVVATVPRRVVATVPRRVARPWAHRLRWVRTVILMRRALSPSAHRALKREAWASASPLASSSAASG